ncbi:hypothetical protein R6H26_04855 [Altericista sp. CCNU0014]
MIGTGLIRQCQGSDRLIDRAGDRLFLAIWLGLIIFCIGLLATSIIVPLSPLVGLVVAFSLSGVALLNRRTRLDLYDLKRQVSPTQSRILCVVMVAISAISSQEVTWNDTGLYHYGVIRWLADFGTVPGVALLFENFGFTSSWFALASPFNPAFLGDRASGFTNSFVLLLAVLQFLWSMVRIFQLRARRSDWFIIAFMGIILPLVIGFHSLAQIRISPSPDFPVILLAGTIAWSYLLLSDQKPPLLSSTAEPFFSDVAIDPKLNLKLSAATNSKSQLDLPSAALIPLVLAAGTLTIKLIAIPLVIVTGLRFSIQQLTFPGFSSQQRCQRLLVGGLILSCLISPLIIHSLITSGCPLFPSSMFCLNVSWSLPPDQLQAVMRSTQQWITWYGKPPAGANPWVWGLTQWFTTDSMNQILAVLILASIGVAVYLLRIAVKKKIPDAFWIVAMALLGIGFILMKAPFFRFMCGLLGLMPAFAIALYCGQSYKSFPLNCLLKLQRGQSRQLLAWSITIALFFVSILTVIQLRGQYSRVLIPPPLRQAKTIQKRVNDLTYNSPGKKGLCWASPLPCAFIVKDVTLRDPRQGIRAGFRRFKNEVQHPDQDCPGAM